MPLNEACKTKKRNEQKLLHNMRPCCMSTIASSQGCLRCGRISSCAFGFPRFFPGSKGWSHLAYTTLGFVDPVAPDPEGGAAIPAIRRAKSLSLRHLCPPSQDENRAPEALQSLPSDIWLDGQVGDFLPTGAQLTLKQLTQFRDSRSKMQPLLNVGSFLDFRSLGPVWQVSSYMCSEIRGRSRW